MKVIGFSGKAGHGKDTCADIFIREAYERYGAHFVKWPLADALKARVYAELEGKYSLSEVWHDKPEDVRTMLQRVGTEQGRYVFGEDLWTYQVEAFIWRMQETMPFVEGVVIPDVRFPNEVEFVRNAGIVRGTPSKYGICLRIESDRTTATQGTQQLHASEIALDNYTDFHGIIINNKDTTLDDLRMQLSPWVDRMCGPLGTP